MYGSERSAILVRKINAMPIYMSVCVFVCLFLYLNLVRGVESTLHTSARKLLRFDVVAAACRQGYREGKSPYEE